MIVLSIAVIVTGLLILGLAALVTLARCADAHEQLIGSEPDFEV